MKLGEIKCSPQGQLSAAAERGLTIRLPAFLSLTKPTSLPREWRVGEVQEAHWPLQITDFTSLGWLALICTKNIYESENRSFVNSKPKPCYCAYALVEVHRKATGHCPVALNLTLIIPAKQKEPIFIFWSLFRPPFKDKLMRAAKKKTKQGKELGNWENRDVLLGREVEKVKKKDRKGECFIDCGRVLPFCPNFLIFSSGISLVLKAGHSFKLCSQLRNNIPFFSVSS